MSQAEFELCDLLYRRNEMPMGQIDGLLEIIAVICLEWDKDRWSQRSKCISYVALRV